MKLKQVVKVSVITLFSICLTSTSLFASPTNTKGYLWNQSTGQVTPYNLSTFKTVQTFYTPQTNGTLITSESTGSNGLLRSSLPVFDRYDQTKSVVNYTYKYVGETRVDNSQNSVTDASIIFEADNSSSFEASGTVGVSGTVELNAIVGKVEATGSVSGTMSRSWSNGRKYGTATTVPKKQIGKITAYIPGTTSNGSAVYKLYNTTTSNYSYSYKSCGAVVPAKSAWNFVVKIPCN